jgi:hypothetical protein
MLTFEDCLALVDLTEDEILAIAEHENLPETAALELGHYLLHTPGGEMRIRRMIVDDIEHALRCGNFRHSAELKTVLQHFCDQHQGERAVIEPRA